jgi:hypothetical protein
VLSCVSQIAHDEATAVKVDQQPANLADAVRHVEASSQRPDGARHRDLLDVPDLDLRPLEVSRIIGNLVPRLWHAKRLERRLADKRQQLDDKLNLDIELLPSIRTGRPTRTRNSPWGNPATARTNTDSKQVRSAEVGDTPRS